MTIADEGTWTEATDVEVDRVDLVAGAANGTQFLIRKSAQQGLLKADEVRDLLKGSEFDGVEEAERPVDEINSEAEPSADSDDTAGSDAKPVTKADDLDVTEPLAAGDGEGSGSADAPGSPAWEAVDSATARKWAAILARAKNAVELLAERERTEAAVDDGGDDYCNAWDLDDAASAIDAAISLLAPYALGEEMEVEFGSDSPIDEVTKAAKALDDDSSALIVIESAFALKKAGRVLSQSNEAAIRSAVDSLQGVLASLPTAPVAEEVTKEAAVPEQSELEVSADDLLKAALDVAPKMSAFEAFKAVQAGGKALRKAKGDPALAVFDENGKLIGTVDPADLSPIASSAAQADAAGADVADAPKPAGDDAAAAAPAPAAEAPKAAAPAAPAAATVPGTATVQAPPAAAPHPDEQQVTKASIAEAFGEVITPFAEQLPELAKAVSDLRERVEKMAKAPDNRNSPMLYGATGTPGAPSRDGGQLDQFADLRKAVDEAKDPGVKREALQKLSYAEIRARFENR